MRRVLIALAIACTAALAGSGTAAAAGGISGGPVTLMGIDAEDGGPHGHGPPEVYEDVVSKMLANTRNGGDGILVIGAHDDSGYGPKAFWNHVGSHIGEAVTFIAGDEISSRSFAGFQMLAVVSSEYQTWGGLTQAENDRLAARSGDVASFVNRGGALLGLSQDGFANPYQYVGGLGSFTVRTGLGYMDITPTDAGTAAGITDALDVCCWHDTYLEFPEYMKVLATDPHTGEAAAIGGAEVTVCPDDGAAETGHPALKDTPLAGAPSGLVHQYVEPVAALIDGALPEDESRPSLGGTVHQVNCEISATVEQTPVP